MGLAFDILVHVVAIPVVFLGSTVAFDVVHWGLHRAHGSRLAPLRWAGGLHATHHAFLDGQLRVHRELVGANIARHVVPEFLTQVAFAVAVAAFLMVFPVLPWTAAIGAFAIQVVVFALIMKDRGLDVNHRGHEQLETFRDSFFCLPEYHALHHVHPDAHFSSWIKALDYALGTGLRLEGRRVAWVGEASQDVAALRERLMEAGVIEGADAGRAEDPEILVVAGDPELPGTAEVVERFVEDAGSARLPRELWWVREPGERGRLSARSRRVQLRRLERRADAAPHDQARRWVAALRRGQCRA